METKLELNLHEVLTAVPGKLFHAEVPLLNPGDITFDDVIYDSRKNSRNSIFLAIAGERVDGHDFAAQAVQSGATLIIGDNLEKLTKASASFPKTLFLATQSSLESLQKLATFYRRKFSIPVVGLTGSSGKTTTKDLAASILKVSGLCLITEGTLNNHWGVPQMVLRLRRDHRVAVFEMGTSGFGEIASLSAICQPDAGYITTIGASHLEGLGNEEGVLKAKRELFDWIVKHGNERALIFNLDNPHLEKLHQDFLALKQKNLKLITLTQKKKYADVRLTSKKALGLEDRYGWEYEFETPWGAIRGRLPLPGPHNLANAMAAATLSLATGAATVQDVVQGLENAQISKLRSNLFRTHTGAVVYDDSYNANPTSVTALFEAARGIRTSSGEGLSKTVAVVGDMLELGPDSAEYHKEMGRKAAQDGIDVLFATGSFAHAWVDGYREAKGSSLHGAALEFKSHDDLMRALNDEIQSKPRETLVLIKGSRGAKMDQIADKLSKGNG
ncbi:MAG: UDP-N-acetylmuramoyl-tripeptide--D-alanyl-D-alanine ligase [Bdellovibrionota bacterium]